jgi:hypothetical protein
MCETDILREYIAVYVDDLLTAAKDHEKIIKALQGGHKLQHKELGALAYHVGYELPLGLLGVVHWLVL